MLQKEQFVEEQSLVIERKSEVISEQKKRITLLEEVLRLSKIKRFSPSSEKSNQQSLFDEADVCAEQAAFDETPIESEKPQKKEKTGRKPFSDKLPRVQVFIDLSDEEKEGAIDTFYSKVKEELDIIPAKVRILEYMQEKAVFIEQGQRQEKSIPILEKLKVYLEKNQHKVPKDSLTGKAMTYLNNQWEKLIVYCSCGELSISNILAENAIRPFVIGRNV